LRATPICPPAPILDLQVQRILFDKATLRRDKVGSYRIWHDRGPHGQGLPWDDITSRIPQLQLDIALEAVPLGGIRNHPNALAPPTVPLNLSLLFDLDCSVSGIGKLEVSYHLTDITPDVPPTGGVTEQSVIQLISGPIGFSPIVFDLSDTLAKDRSFSNAGVTLDTSGKRLVIMAQVSNSYYAVADRWKFFHDGYVPDHIGTHDWGVLLSAADLKLTLGLPIASVLREALGGQAWRPITMWSTHRSATAPSSR
jgi:hypothetical protein